MASPVRLVGVRNEGGRGGRQKGVIPPGWGGQELGNSTWRLIRQENGRVSKRAGRKRGSGLPADRITSNSKSKTGEKKRWRAEKKTSLSRASMSLRTLAGGGQRGRTKREDTHALFRGGKGGDRRRPVRQGQKRRKSQEMRERDKAKAAAPFCVKRRQWRRRGG